MQTYDMVQAGYGEADITPDSPAEMVGFYRPDNRSQGVMDSLRLQALVWESDGVRGGLIAIDSLGFTVDLSNVIRDRAAAALHTGRERIMVCFSHTHSAPNAAEEPDYFEMVCRKADRAVREAAGNMKPMEAAWGIGENTVGINRRNEPDQMDGRLGILKLAARDGKGKEVLLIRVTAHANVLSGDNYFISADYIGAARKRLEETYNCRVMMVQGAAGDIRPKYHQDNLEYLEVHCCEMARNGFSQEYRKKYGPQSRRALEQMAERIFRSVDAVYGSLVMTPLERLEIRSSFCRVAADVPDMERAGKIAEEAQREAGIDGRMWLEEVRRLLDGGIRRQYADIEIQYLFISQGCLCGVPNEAMCRIAVVIWKEAEAPLLFFNGYTNGCSSYLPTAEEYDKGGYEVLWSNLVYFPYHGRVMPLNRDTAGIMAMQVVRDWKKGNHKSS